MSDQAPPHRRNELGDTITDAERAAYRALMDIAGHGLPQASRSLYLLGDDPT